MPRWLEMLTTRPKPRSYIAGRAALARRKGASTITRCIRAKVSGGNSVIGATCCRPALLTSTSTSRLIPASAAVSPRSTTHASPPTSSATRRAPSPSRSATTTLAPAAASRRAQARPMPLAAPVTRALRPVRSNDAPDVSRTMGRMVDRRGRAPAWGGVGVAVPRPGDRDSSPPSPGTQGRRNGNSGTRGSGRDRHRRRQLGRQHAGPGPRRSGHRPRPRRRGGAAPPGRAGLAGPPAARDGGGRSDARPAPLRGRGGRSGRGGRLRPGVGARAGGAQGGAAGRHRRRLPARGRHRLQLLRPADLPDLGRDPPSGAVRDRPPVQPAPPHAAGGGGGRPGHGPGVGRGGDGLLPADRQAAHPHPAGGGRPHRQPDPGRHLPGGAPPARPRGGRRGRHRRRRAQRAGHPLGPHGPVPDLPPGRRGRRHRAFRRAPDRAVQRLDGRPGRGPDHARQLRGDHRRRPGRGGRAPHGRAGPPAGRGPGPCAVYWQPTLSGVSMRSSNKVVISCAVTGSIHTPSMSGALPISPAEIARDAIDAAEAGATILHLHARDPETGFPSPDPDVFLQFLTEIRAHTDAVINITTGGSAVMSVDERIAAAKTLQPEVASLNMGSMNFNFAGAANRVKDWKFDWERDYVLGSADRIFANTFTQIEKILTDLGANG